MGQLQSQEVATQRNKKELNQHQERSRGVSGGCSAESARVHQYFCLDELRARLTEHLAATTREVKVTEMASETKHHPHIKL